MPTFYDRFLECAERWPNRTALEFQSHDHLESCTYAELRRMADCVGRWVTENGSARGARLAILADNHPRWVAIYLGIIAAGCASVPLDTALHADQVAKLLADSGSSAIFFDAAHLAAASQAVDGLGIRLVLMDPEHLEQISVHEQRMENLPAIFDAGPEKFTSVNSKPDDLTSLVYTSGTTSDPKGVMLTHANLLAEVDAVFNWRDIRPSDVLLGALPLFHVLGLMANLLLPLTKGSRVVYLDTLNTTELLRALRERRITVFAAVPQFYYLIHDRIFQDVAKRNGIQQKAFHALLTFNRSLRKVGINAGPIFFSKVHQALGKVRYWATGGSRFDPAIASSFYALGIDVLQAYGLTETSGIAFANRPDDNVIGSVGKTLHGVEAKIVDPRPQEEGGPNVGEVALRGAIVMKGYWNRPDAIVSAMSDGWFLTGDLGYFDSYGHLFLLGRKKEVITLSDGNNIYPEEIEAQYLKSPFIKEIAVIGLERRPGEGAGVRLHAVVVPDFNTLKQRKVINAKEVIRFDIESLSSQLASTKRIGGYEIWQDDLPRTTTGKLKRFEIEKGVRAKQAQGSGADSDLAVEQTLTADENRWLERSEVKRALKVVRGAARIEMPVLRPSHNLELDLALDSIQRVELLSQLECEFGSDVEESRLAEIYTVRDLVDTVLESIAAQGVGPKTHSAFAGWKTTLAEDPQDQEILALAKPQPITDAALYLSSRLLQIIALDRSNLHVHGIEKLPGNGPYILCSNHQSYIDPLIMASIMPTGIFYHLFAFGTSEIFGGGVMRHLARWIRVVVVDPDARLIPAMRAGAFGLRQGRVLILYPEGERSIDGKPKAFKKGAAILATNLQVPLVPVAIEGFHDVWPRNKPFQGFRPLKIEFGEPIYPPPESEASEAACEKLTAELKARVVGMWEKLRRHDSDLEPVGWS